VKRLLLIFLLFSVLSVLGAGLFLKKGIHLEHLQVDPVTFENITLQWRSKLELQIERLRINTADSTAANESIDLSSVGKIIPLMRWVDRFFAKITVQEISAGEITADFLYAASAGHFNLFSPYGDLRSNFILKDGVLNVTIKELSNQEFQSKATGVVNIDLARQTAEGVLEADLAGSLPLDIIFSADQQQLTFSGKENAVITNITPFVDLFGLSPDIQCWITEYLTGTRYQLKEFSGSFPLDNPLHLLESFTAEVRVEGCQYTFAPGLEAIKTAYTDVFFKKGVLNIIPHESTFYGQDGEKSWLDINFNDVDNILLTAYILTNAVGNDDIMNLLEYYDIPLPFVQTDGKTKIDLTLAINLNKLLIDATGTFRIDEGIVEYDEIPYRIKDAALSLKNSLVSIEKLNLAYETILQADLSGFFDAAGKQGDLDIVLQSLAIPVGKSLLHLDSSQPSPVLQYHISPKGDRGESSESFWLLNGAKIHLGAFSTPFSFADYSGTLSPVTVTGDADGGKIRTRVGGSFSAKNRQVDLQGFLEEFHFKSLHLQSEEVPVRISYNDGLFIEHKQNSQWLLEQVPVTLHPTTGSYQNHIATVVSKKIRYGDIFEGGVEGSYNIASEKGEYTISEPSLLSPALSELLKPESLTLQLDGSGDFLKLAVPELGLSVSTRENKQWTAHLNDLKAVYDRSPLLQQVKIDSGSLTVRSEDDGKLVAFSADIPWHYSLLVLGDQPVNRYVISGTVQDSVVEADINDKIQLRYTDSLELHSQQILFNLPEIAKFSEECFPHQDDKKEGENTFVTVLHAQDSGFYLSPNSQIIADTLTLRSVGDDVNIDISSGSGEIVVSMEGKEFSLQGTGLNDTFMDALFPEAYLKGGTMTVAAKGNADNFSFLVDIKKTVLKEFVTLNNVLALVNTIPALITFSLPSYTNSGLHVSSAVFGAEVIDGIASIRSLSVKSPELSMTGKGWIDFPQEKINMDLNLITQSNKNVRKIPLVGYILAGEKKQPSITIEVSGDLNDPDVEHKAFQKVATIPFNILYRTLSLPSHIVSPLFNGKAQADSEQVGTDQDTHAK